MRLLSIIAAALLLCCASTARADPAQAIVTSSCGTAPLGPYSYTTLGALVPLVVDETGTLCTPSGGSGANVNITGLNGTAPSTSNPLFVAPGSGQTFPVSASALPLPTGAATAANQAPSANVTATDCSGTISSGGTAQNAFTAQTTLHGFTIANIDPTSGSGEPLWISFTTTAAASTAGSYPLAAPTATTFASLSSFTTPPGFGLNHALSVIATTTGHKFSCTWW